MNKTTLVAGASGATGKRLVDQLLSKDQKVKVIVRSGSNIPESWKSHDNLSIIEASILDISPDEMADHIKDCGAIASCLGHNLHLKGIFGKPRLLVRDSVKLLCDAIKKNKKEEVVKFVLMNTTANRNKDLDESHSSTEKLVFSLIRLLIPPQRDNEKAAEYLRIEIGQNDPNIEWVAVRPDGLIDEEEVSEYDVYPSPIRSVVFNAGKTSRINVGNFMARLIVENELWQKWKGQMPVIYNKEQ